MSRTLPQPPDPVYTFKGSMTLIHCFFLELDKERLYAGTKEGIVHVWDLKINRQKTQFQVGRRSCLAIEKTCDGLFVTQIKCGSLKFWSSQDLDWTLIREMPLGHMGFCKIKVYDHLLFYPGREDGEFKWLDMSRNTEHRAKHDLSVQRGPLMFLKFLRTAELIVAGFELSLAVFNKDGRLLSELSIPDDTVMAFDYNESASLGVLGTSGETVVKLALVDNTRLSVVMRRSLTNPGVSAVAIRNDGRLCALGCWDGRIRYFATKNMTLVAVLDYQNRTAFEVVMFCPKRLSQMKENSLLTGDCNGRVNIWDLYCEAD